MPEPASREPNATPHRRRPRYRGTHPRSFSEKYKEQNPERYGETVEKVISSGKTPAGMHRPIMVREVMEVLRPAAGEVGVDATLGYGGHCERLLASVLPGGKVIGLDVDPIELPRTEERLRAKGYGPREFVAVQSNYAGISKAVAAEGLEGVDFVLADLGVSSMQIDDPRRGFTFKQAGPLDLRMNPNRGEPAARLLEKTDAATLEGILMENADEPNARALSRAMEERQKEKPIRTTVELRDLIRQEIERLHGRGSDWQSAAQRVFQALRIVVNDEFSALESFLRQLPGVTRGGGRIVILTFHSGEDRRVKHAFREGFERGVYSSVSGEVGRASLEERRENPRSSPAKLRWAVRGKG
ncbi:MAG: 16S rRNA (cytosine(1402)-N(4))-methyltransferase RsmH [Verrucomicrobiota bacterium]|nr:16S rRNA (cytosine(1402)-N(4))-methyltransferase RsmH [Verrucomicrobiota bacterium]